MSVKALRYLSEMTAVAFVLLAAATAAADESGELVWAKRATPTAGEISIAGFSDGSSVVTGRFQGSAVFGPGEANETTLISAGRDDVFVARYNANGTLAWARGVGAAIGHDRGSGVAALPDGSSLVTGEFNGSVVFGAGEPNATTLVSAGSVDLFIARYNANGTLAWARRAGGVSTEEARGMGASSDGSSVITGLFRSSAVFGAGEANETTLVAPGINAFRMYAARYNADGTLAWARQAVASGHAAAAFSDGSSIVTGNFSTSVVLGAGEPNETTLVSAGGVDVLVARYNANGTLAWARCAGGASLGAAEQGRGVTAFSDGSSVVAGVFAGSAVFGIGEPNATTLVSASGDFDIFVARYNADGTLAWARRAGSGSFGDQGQAVAGFPNGSSVVTGSFAGTAAFGPGEPNATTLVALGSGGTDVFVARYDADGSLAWARRAGGSQSDLGNGVAAFSDGSIVVTGRFLAPATFGAGEPNQTTFSTSGMFVARYSGGQHAAVVAPADIVQECDCGCSECDCGASGCGTVHFVFDVVPGAAGVLRVRDATGDRLLLEVASPGEQQYGVGPVDFPLGSSTVLIELLDGATVVASAQFAVQIQDTIAPVITGAVDRTIELQGPLTTLYKSLLGIAVTDACDFDPTLTFAPGALGLGTTEVTATARDATGNTSSCTFDVTVVDTTPPVFLVIPQDIERHCEAGGALVSFDVLAEDFSGVVDVVCEDQDGEPVDPSGTLFDVGEHTVTCTAADGSGNTATCVFLVTVVDDEAPVIVVPADIVVGNEPGTSFAYVTFEVAATDLCDPDVAIRCETSPGVEVESGDAFPMGTTTVTCTASDHSGNEASSSFNVTVKDVEPPVIVAPAALTLETDCAGSPLTVTAASLGVSATDNWDANPTITVAPASLGPGTTTVVVTATDHDGNSSETTIEATVLRGRFELRFLQPLDANVDNRIRAGQTVPVKVRVTCDNVVETDVSAVIHRVERIDGQGTVIANEAVQDNAGAGDVGTAMRLADVFYIYNLSTAGWATTSGARFRVTIRVTALGHVDTEASVILKNR